MTHERALRAARRGFTLIEALIVIAIITILVSLTAAGVMKFLSKGPKVKTQSEISQLDNALQAAELELNVPYLPSFLILREDNQYYNNGNPALGVQFKYQNTVNFLVRAFGKQINLQPTQGNVPLPNGPGIDWNGDGVIDHVDHVLQGYHCLAFWLGGIPTPPGGTVGFLGFSTNPQNPAAVGGTRRGPFFNQFDAKRLVRELPTAAAPSHLYYLDAWSSPQTIAAGTAKPYAYFSAYGTNNGYSGYWGQVVPGVLNDCPSIFPGPNPPVVAGKYPQATGPYYQMSGPTPPGTPTVTYSNPKTHQIISAGQDENFGIGGWWDPITANTYNDLDKDNQTNFSGSTLIGK